MKQLKAKILSNEEVVSGFYKMRIRCEYLARSIKPGQFLEVRCSDGVDPLLRRPLGCHRILKGGIELLYEVVGNGTTLLSQKRSGEHIDIIGPLGNVFSLDGTSGRPASRKTIIVAGGIGIAPLFALAEKIVHKFASSPVRKLTNLKVLIGARTKEKILCEKELKKLGCEVAIATDDGSRGHKGLVTDLLGNILRTNEPTNQRTNIYACGPAGMLKVISQIARKHGLACQVLLEEYMACGIGVCLGCPVKVREFASSRVHEPKHTNTRTHEHTNYTYKLVCKDGPVFDAEEIIW